MSLLTHVQKYQRNRRVLHDLLGLESPPYDWVVTVAFYSALHLVENVINSHGVESKNHVVRKRLIREIPRLRVILSSYVELEKESRKSRYELVEINSDNATLAIHYLTAIEDHLRSESQPTPCP